MDNLPEIPYTEAAVVLDAALRVARRLYDNDIEEKRASDPLPRGMLKCGEAISITTVCVALLLRAYPHLNDAREFQEAMSIARILAAGGEPN